jgi:hypothetical protein
MRSDENQRLVFEYLLARFRDQKPFEKIDLQHVTSWTESSFETYWSKQLKRFLVRAHSGKDQEFRVGESFRLYSSWERFQKHVTQSRGGSSDYTSLIHDNIIVFEFFMPLTNEEHLRTSLDSLFYRDTILRRLRSIDRDKLGIHFPPPSGATEDAHLEGVATWIGDHFGGYSISHVNGRFRAGEIVTRAIAAEIQQDGARYLIDETTAVVRFIFPCGQSVRREAPLSSDAFAEAVLHAGAPAGADVLTEASKIRWAFGVLFVQSIVQVVNGEAEIWMVESGMRNRLHIWRVETDES